MTESHHDSQTPALGATRPHRTHAADFDLPVELKDKTAHVFTLSDDGPSEFNVVVSTAKASASDSLNEIAERLIAELRRALPKFQLERRQESHIDGSPSGELYYGWNNNGIAMQQRQAIVMVESAVDGEPELLLVAATCLNKFNDKWHARFDQLLASMRLSRPWPPRGTSPAIPEPVDEPPIVDYGFALGHDGTLAVLPNIAALVEGIPAKEVDSGKWKFYDLDGLPLEVRWESPLSRNLLRRSAPTHFQLAPASEASGLGPLQHRLALIERVGGEMQSLSEVQTYFKHRERIRKLQRDSQAGTRA